MKLAPIRGIGLQQGEKIMYFLQLARNCAALELEMLKAETELKLKG
jgi:hypothetical protein